jgi:ABC-2 type transport system permease protein
VFPFLWLAIYQDRTTVADFSQANIVTYYLVIAVVVAMASTHTSEYLKRDIVEGKLNEELVKPLGNLLFRFVNELAYKAIYTVLITVIVVFIIVVFPQYVVFPNSGMTVFLFIVSLIIAFLLSFAIQIVIGMVAFWFSEINALKQMLVILEDVFSGKIAPLAFFPLYLQIFANFLPFKYLAYFSNQIYLQKISSHEMWSNFALAGGWLVLLYGIAFFLWHRGLKRYDGTSV